MKLILYIILLTASCFSQTFEITGTITDTLGNSLPGVNIILLGTELGAASDRIGYYEIQGIHPGIYSIEFSSVGYKKTTIRDIKIDDHNIKVDVIMKEEVIESEQVIVTAGKYEQKISDLPVSAEIIPSERFSEKNLINLKEALRYVPGVNMVEDQISIRGSSGYSRGAGTRVLVAIDGIPFYTGDTGEIIWEAVPVTQIQRVEIIKGAASSLYGSTAIGGVINIITPEIHSEPKTYIRSLFGIWDNPSHKEWDWSNELRTFSGLTISHSQRFDHFGIALSLTRLQDMNYKQSGFFTRYIGYLKSDYKFSATSSLTLLVNSLNHRTGNFLFWKDSRNALVPRDEDQGQRTRANRYMIGLIYKDILNDNLFLNIRSSFYRTDWRDETTSRNSSKTNLYRTEVQANLSLSENLIWVSGIEGTYGQVNSNIFGKPVSRGFGIYSQIDLKFDFPLKLNFGARYDYSKLDSLKSFGDFSPKLGLNYYLTDNLILRSSVGVGFRAPSLAEAFTSTVASGITIKPNPNLKPEKSLSTEIGINYRLNENINFDAAFFNNEFYDFIDPDVVVDVSGNNFGIFQNISRARIQGFEINSLINLFNSNVNLSLNYTYLWSRDIKDKKALKYRPRHISVASLSYSVFNFEAGIDFRYWSKVEEIDFKLVDLFRIKDGEKRVEVFLLDLRTGYNFLSLGLPIRLFLNANNIFNYNYVELIGNIAPIRNYSISLELLF